MKKIAKTQDFGTLDWVEKNNKQRLDIYFGGMDEWKKLPSKS